MAKGKAETLFRSKAPGIMSKFMADFTLDLLSSAAILGNIGHECAGFTAMQEIKPTVAGSRGGFGWPMWTGPRRRNFEAYCKRNKLDPASDQANYAYMFVELSGSEKKAIAAVKAAIGLEAKVKAFELAYERAGAKHYASRNQWAKIALDAWEWSKPASVPMPTPGPVIIEKPVVADPGELESSPAKSKTVWTWALAGIGSIVTAGGDFLGGLDWRVQLFICAVTVCAAVYGIKRRFDLARAVKDLKAEFE